MEENLFKIYYKYSQYLDIDNSDSANIEEIMGDIYMIITDEEFNENEIKIGIIELQFVNFGFLGNDISVYETLCNHGLAEDRIAVAILNEKYDSIHERIIKKIGDGENENLLIIKNLILHQDYRNKGYGKIILSFIEKLNFYKAGYMVLESFPKQLELGHFFENNNKLYLFDNLETDKIISQKKLNKFYSNCGFYKVPKTDVFIKRISFH